MCSAPNASDSKCDSWSRAPWRGWDHVDSLDDSHSSHREARAAVPFTNSIRIIGGDAPIAIQPAPHGSSSMIVHPASLLAIALALFSPALSNTTASPCPRPQELLDPKLTKAELEARRERANKQRSVHEQRGELLGVERQSALEGLFASQVHALAMREMQETARTAI